VSLWGIHGETSYNEYAAKPGDVVAVAWGGVAAQVVLMLLALGLTQLVPFSAIPFGSELGLVMFVVLVKLNIFLMIVALLPIGPFDGHAAWQVIRRTRAKLKAKAPPKAKPVPPHQPEVPLSNEQQQELDAAAEQEAADLIKRLTGKSDTEHRG
jgi:hypothetical protein